VHVSSHLFQFLSHYCCALSVTSFGKHGQDCIMASEEIRVVCACLKSPFSIPHTIVVHSRSQVLSLELFFLRWRLVFYLGQRTSALRRSPAACYAASAGDAYGAQCLLNQHMPLGAPRRILSYFLYHATKNLYVLCPSGSLTDA
jgi:hypothetical protein